MVPAFEWPQNPFGEQSACVVAAVYSQESRRRKGDTTAPTGPAVALVSPEWWPRSLKDSAGKAEVVVVGSVLSVTSRARPQSNAVGGEVLVSVSQVLNRPCRDTLRRLVVTEIGGVLGGRTESR